MGRIAQNTNRYYRRVQVKNLMWVSFTSLEGPKGPSFFMDKY
jgi:hypothetical protein